MPFKSISAAKGSSVLARIAPKILFVVLVVLGTFLRMQQFTHPWTTDFRGQCGSYYGNIARNYVNWGYGASKLAPVVSVNPQSPAEFRYYLNHPPMLAWLLGISFKVFGIHEWSVRLVPLCFSFLTMILFYFFVRRVWNEEAALYSLAVFAMLPMGVFYGAFADAQGPLPLFFVILILHLYQRFVESRSGRALLLMYAAFVAGLFSDWAVYYLAVLLPVYHLLNRRPRKIAVCMLFPTALAGVIAFLGYAAWVERGVFEIDIGLFQYLTVTRATPEGSSVVVGFFEIVKIWALLLTVPATLMLAGWALAIPELALLRRGRPEDWMLWLLFAFGLLHIALFSVPARYHDWWSYYMLPSASIACGLAMCRLRRLLSRIKPAVGVAAVALLIILLGVSSYLTRRALYKGRSGLDIALVAQYMGEHCDRRSYILTDYDADILLHYYLNNPAFRGPVNKTNYTIMSQSPRAGYILTFEPYLVPGEDPFRWLLIRHMELNHPDRIASTPLAKILDIRGMDRFDYAQGIAPPSVTDVEIEDRAVRLRWTHPHPEKVAHYRVYRRRDDIPFYFMSTDVSGDTAVVDNVLRERLWIVVVAVDKSGEESGFEEEIRGWR